MSQPVYAVSHATFVEIVANARAQFPDQGPDGRWGIRWGFSHPDAILADIARTVRMDGQLNLSRTVNILNGYWSGKLGGNANEAIQFIERQLKENRVRDTALEESPVRPEPTPEPEPTQPATDVVSVVHDFRDIGFTVVATPVNYNVVGFKVYEITSHRDDPEIQWQRRDSSYSPDPVGTVEEAEVYLEGTVKWDGCSDLTFAKGEGEYYHFCSARQAANTGLLLARLYEIAHAAVKQPNFDVAKVTVTY